MMLIESIIYFTVKQIVCQYFFEDFNKDEKRSKRLLKAEDP